MSKATDTNVAPALRQVCADIALTLSDTLLDYQMYKSLKALEQLAGLSQGSKEYLLDLVLSYEV